MRKTLMKLGKKVTMHKSALILRYPTRPLGIDSGENQKLNILLDTFNIGTVAYFS